MNQSLFSSNLFPVVVIFFSLSSNFFRKQSNVSWLKCRYWNDLYKLAWQHRLVNSPHSAQDLFKSWTQQELLSVISSFKDAFSTTSSFLELWQWHCTRFGYCCTLTDILCDISHSLYGHRIASFFLLSGLYLLLSPRIVCSVALPLLRVTLGWGYTRTQLSL